jgi:hypothetical protein
MQFFYLLCSQFRQKASCWINKTLLLVKQQKLLSEFCVKMHRVASKIRIGRVTVNTHIFFFWPQCIAEIKHRVYVCKWSFFLKYGQIWNLFSFSTLLLLCSEIWAYQKIENSILCDSVPFGPTEISIFSTFFWTAQDILNCVAHISFCFEET